MLVSKNLLYWESQLLKKPLILYNCNTDQWFCFYFYRHEIQGGRKYYKKFKKEVHHTLNFKPHIQSFAQANLLNIAKKVFFISSIVVDN